MSLAHTYAVCPQCQGAGIVTNGGTLTCPTCSGVGAYFQTNEGKHLYYRLPEFIDPTEGDSIRKARRLRYTLATLGFLTFFGSLVALFFSNAATLSELLWAKSWTHALFGVSGLASMYSLAAIERHESSTRSLHDLPTHLSKEPAVDLSHYANPRVLEILKQAGIVAQNYHSTLITDTIVLITLLRHPRIQNMLSRLEHSSQELIEYLQPAIPPESVGYAPHISIDRGVRTRIYIGFEEAIAHDFPYLDIEDILLGYARPNDPHAKILAKYGLTYDELYAVSRWYAEDQEQAREWQFWLERGRARPGGYMNRAWTALPTPFLDQYSLDLTQLAASGRVPTVTVRNAEIDQAMQILGRTQKNSVLLVGEPGVGKNAILGAIALRMIEERVPEILKDKRLVSMDLGALLSDDKSAEQNIQRVLQEVAQAGNVILVIEDVHSLVGTGGGALDAASLLANAIGRGEVQVISTASYGDYHHYVETNASLSNLLDIVEIKEPTVEQAITILEEEAATIEARQHVFLTYPAIKAAVELAKRYLPNKTLPDSALSVLDEAASRVQLEGRGWVGKRDVEQAVERTTNVPIQEASTAEADMLLHMEEHLHQRIIGQEEAVRAIAEALRRSRAGLSDQNRPIASFLFVGPTGVGKTEMAKTLADLYFGRQATLLRLDMSEYQDNRSVYRLIGAPAADSESFTEGGALTQPIREHPFSLILLDELEKADPDVLNLFLQLLDDGRLTENTGRTVHFNNTIIIATSNAGAPEILSLIEQGMRGDILRTQILSLLQKQFRPEFLNRFDAIIPFRPLTTGEIQAVARLMLQGVVARAAAQKYEVSFTGDAVAKVAELGYDPLYGARPLRHVIQEKVEGLLAKKILERSIVPGEPLQITAEMIH